MKSKFQLNSSHKNYNTKSLVQTNSRKNENKTFTLTKKDRDKNKTFGTSFKEKTSTKNDKDKTFVTSSKEKTYSTGVRKSRENLASSYNSNNSNKNQTQYLKSESPHHTAYTFSSVAKMKSYEYKSKKQLLIISSKKNQVSLKITF